jgi:hypothetical protein
MKKMKLFFVWDDSSSNEIDHFWMHYDSLEDAVSDRGDGCEVFTAELKRLGHFKRKAEIVKIKARKKVKARKKK